MHSLFMKELSTCSLGLMKLVHEIDLLVVNIERKVSIAHCFCRLIRLLLFMCVFCLQQTRHGIHSGQRPGRFGRQPDHYCYTFYVSSSLKGLVKACVKSHFLISVFRRLKFHDLSNAGYITCPDYQLNV